MAVDKRVYAVAAVAVVAAVIAGILLYAAYVRVGSTGRVVVVGVKVDVSSIFWGELAPGENVTRSIVVTNNGTSVVALNIATQNFAPAAAESYLAFWTDMAANQTLAAGASVPVQLRLEVSKSITGVTDFSFDVIVTGTKP